MHVQRGEGRVSDLLPQREHGLFDLSADIGHRDSLRLQLELGAENIRTPGRNQFEASLGHLVVALASREEILLDSQAESVTLGDQELALYLCQDTVQVPFRP